MNERTSGFGMLTNGNINHTLITLRTKMSMNMREDTEICTLQDEGSFVGCSHVSCLEMVLAGPGKSKWANKCGHGKV